MRTSRESNFDYGEMTSAVETTEDGTNTTYYQYDANGNLVLRSKELIAMTYNESNLTLKQNDSSVDFFQFNDYGEMTSAYVNGKKSTYSYRPDGLRINKMVDGVRTRHVLDGQNVSMDLNDDWSMKFGFLRGVRLVGYIDGANGSKYFYNFNAHGDVLGAVGGLNSTAQTRYTYDAFGNSSKTGSSANPFQYCGEYADDETGLIYLRARYYDPAIGSFISEDPARAELNWYSYCRANPIRYIDPSGLDSYVFYDPNLFGNRTGEAYAQKIKEELSAYYGTDTHIIPITDADYFIEKWNVMGRAGNKKIEGVTILSHANYHLIEFGTQATGEGTKKDTFDMKDISKLNKKTMDALVLLGCQTGKVIDGKTNFATEMTNRMNAKYTIASDSLVYHKLKDGKYILSSDDGIRSKGFKVYEKLPNGKASAVNVDWIDKYEGVVDLIEQAKKKWS